MDRRFQSRRIRGSAYRGGFALFWMHGRSRVILWRNPCLSFSYRLSNNFLFFSSPIWGYPPEAPVYQPAPASSFKRPVAPLETPSVYSLRFSSRADAPPSAFTRPKVSPSLPSWARKPFSQAAAHLRPLIAPRRLLWYFSARPKSPFKIPIRSGILWPKLVETLLVLADQD